ncbi:MAG: AMP-binding protein [Clostridia bacterium]|nr:AMP-binding protein [Clostridia bacterium]
MNSENINKPRTIRQMLISSAEKYPENNAFLIKKEEEIFPVTYKSFKADVDALAAAFLKVLGLRGKKIAISGKNSYEWCLTYMAVMSGVGILVPIDKELTGQEIANILNMSKADAIICDNEVAEKILKNIHSIDNRPVMISCEEREKDSLIPLHVLLQKGYELLSQGFCLPEEGQIMPQSLAVLLFTSGTTGVAKGVMLSNDNLCSDLAAVTDSVEITSEDRSLSVLPLHHTYESIAFLMVICKGGCICFCRSFRYLLRDFGEYQPTVFVSVPLILEKIHSRIISVMEKEGKLRKVRLFSVVAPTIRYEKRKEIFSDIHTLFGGRLKKIIVGAAALQKNVAEDFELFGIPIIIGYGLTECSPIVICNSDTERTPDSIGKPIKTVQVKIVDSDEQGIGEIHVKGPMVMLGYYNNRDETEKVMRDGWFNTGDLGYRDKNGNYHITGRSKNVIVTNTGKNIYPEELEFYLSKSPFVKECLVYSIETDIITAEVLPDEEEVKQKAKKDDPTEKEIYAIINDVVKSVNRKLPSYKRIRRLVIRNNEFDKTTTHKIKRKQ